MVLSSLCESRSLQGATDDDLMDPPAREGDVAETDAELLIHPSNVAAASARGSATAASQIEPYLRQRTLNPDTDQLPDDLCMLYGGISSPRGAFIENGVNVTVCCAESCGGKCGSQTCWAGDPGSWACCSHDIGDSACCKVGGQAPCTLKSRYCDPLKGRVELHEAGPWESHFLDAAAESKNARCLDGSPAMYWLSPGYGSGAKKWMFWHEAGAWCFSPLDCLARVKGQGWLHGFGTSTYERAKGSLSGDVDQGLLNRKDPQNPVRNWNFVYMKYCDGFSWIGNRETPIWVHDPGKPGKLMEIFLRGHAILEATLDDLMGEGGEGGQTPMKDAEQILVAGSSAGALSTILNCDYYKERADKLGIGTKVHCAADSGWFEIPAVAANKFPHYRSLDTPVRLPNYAGMEQDFNGIDQSWRAAVSLHLPVLNSDCMRERPTWHCAVASVAAEYTRTPLFIMQSVYDTWQMSFMIFCSARGQTAHKCGNDEIMNFGDVIKQDVLGWVTSSNSARRGHAAFIDKCTRHGRSVDPAPFHSTASTNLVSSDSMFLNTGIKLNTAQALLMWMGEDLGVLKEHVNTSSAVLKSFSPPGSTYWIQDGSYPCTECCHAEPTPPLPTKMTTAAPTTVTTTVATTATTSSTTTTTKTTTAPKSTSSEPPETDSSAEASNADHKKKDHAGEDKSKEELQAKAARTETTTQAWYLRWKKTTTTNDMMFSVEPVKIMIGLTLANIPFASLSTETATSVLLAIKEAVAIVAGDDISADMVSVKLTESRKSDKAIQVHATVTTPAGTRGQLVQQALAVTGQLEKEVATWVSWAHALPDIETGAIRVQDIVVSDKLEPVNTELTVNTELAQIGSYGQSASRFTVRVSFWWLLPLAAVIGVPMLVWRRRRRDISVSWQYAPAPLDQDQVWPSSPQYSARRPGFFPAREPTGDLLPDEKVYHDIDEGPSARD